MNITTVIKKFLWIMCFFCILYYHTIYVICPALDSSAKLNGVMSLILQIAIIYDILLVYVSVILCVLYEVELI